MRAILNLRNNPRPNGIRCDRTTPLGNPFYMSTEADRDPVCEAYEVYFRLVMHGDVEPKDAADMVGKKYPVVLLQRFKFPTRAAFIVAAEELYEKPEAPLLCWCAPKRCHCETLARWGFLQRRIFENNNFTGEE